MVLNGFALSLHLSLTSLLIFFLFGEGDYYALNDRCLSLIFVLHGYQVSSAKPLAIIRLKRIMQGR